MPIKITTVCNLFRKDLKDNLIFLLQQCNHLLAKDLLILPRVKKAITQHNLWSLKTLPLQLPIKFISSKWKNISPKSTLMIQTACRFVVLRLNLSLIHKLKKFLNKKIKLRKKWTIRSSSCKLFVTKATNFTKTKSNKFGL